MRGVGKVVTYVQCVVWQCVCVCSVAAVSRETSAQSDGSRQKEMVLNISAERCAAAWRCVQQQIGIRHGDGIVDGSGVAQ